MARLDIVQCQGCHGDGGETDVVFDGTGPWEVCGYCGGRGRTTRMMNGWIMRLEQYRDWAPSCIDEYVHANVMATDEVREAQLAKEFRRRWVLEQDNAFRAEVTALT